MTFYIQPSWMYGQSFAGQALYGHISSFNLSPIPMINHKGDRVDWEDFSGRPLYITAGFTSCPNTCPVTMSYYQQLAHALNGNASFSMLTIDPLRDTKPVFSAYLNAINQDFIGLIIEDEKLLNQVTTELKQSVFVSKAGNQIIHKGYIYLLHPKVNGLIIYTQTDLDISKMVSDIQLLNEHLGRDYFAQQNSEA